MTEVAVQNLSESVKKKITVKEIIGDPAFFIMKPGDAEKDAVDLFAYVTGSKLETSPLGDYYRWMGQFKAINLVTGEVFLSSNAILPAIASDYVEAAYTGGNKIGGDAGNVMVGMRIGIKYQSGNKGITHGWTMRIIRPADTRSPLDMFMEAVTVPQLAGPVEEGKLAEPDGAETPRRKGQG